jgi:hypothetical protein
MALNQETQDILRKAGLTGDALAAASAAFDNEALQTALRENTMLRSDYSRKQDELTRRTKELEENWKTANEEYQRMQTTVEATNAEVAEAKAKAEEAAAKLAETEAKVVDTTGFITADQLKEQVRQLALGQTAYYGEVDEALTDIRELVPGTRVSARSLMAAAAAANKSPREYAEEQYKLGEVRATRERDARQKEITEAEERGFQRAVAESANPSTRPMAESRDPFYVPKPGSEGGGMNPWDSEATPPDEAKLLSELQQVGRA